MSTIHLGLPRAAGVAYDDAVAIELLSYVCIDRMHSSDALSRQIYLALAQGVHVLQWLAICRLFT